MYADPDGYIDFYVDAFNCRHSYGRILCNLLYFNSECLEHFLKQTSSIRVNSFFLLSFKMLNTYLNCIKSQRKATATVI